MKRIVYLIPDKKFGGAFEKLKNDYYPTYDIKYEPLMLADGSAIIHFAGKHLEAIHSRVESIKKDSPNIYDTPLLDLMGDLLKSVYEFFITITADQLVSKDGELAQNAKTLNGFRAKLGLP